MNVKQIGEEQIPFEDGDDSHRDEGEEHKEKVMVDLQPIWRSARIEGTARRPGNEGMIHGHRYIATINPGSPVVKAIKISLDLASPSGEAVSWLKNRSRKWRTRSEN
jgi:hypothetical protein